MGLSPDGPSVAVSDSTANVVHIPNVRTGEERWTFTSGDSPHENNWSKDGSLIYRTRWEVATTPVDDHPQRMRMGVVRTDWLRAPALTGSRSRHAHR